MFFFFFFDDNAIEQGESAFESIKHTDETGGEYWTARELMPVLEYVEWRKFRSVIKKAMKACEASKHRVSDHFVGAAKMINLAKGAVREVEDYNLTRYACYLIAMNGDPRKKAIAMAQTYFAVKTRQQEIFEQCGELSEDAKRLAIRQQMKERNKMLANAAKAAGIEQGFEYAVFQDEGYKGLYGGLTAKGIHARKGLQKDQQILDYMSGTELAANLFRATQTEEKLRRENIHGRQAANQAHFDVGRKVRQTIAELGGTMPENLPTPTKSIKQVEREQIKPLPHNSTPIKK